METDRRRESTATFVWNDPLASITPHSTQETYVLFVARDEGSRPK